MPGDAIRIPLVVNGKRSAGSSREDREASGNYEEERSQYNDIIIILSTSPNPGAEVQEQTSLQLTLR